MNPRVDQTPQRVLSSRRMDRFRTNARWARRSRKEDWMNGFIATSLVRLGCSWLWPHGRVMESRYESSERETVVRCTRRGLKRRIPDWKFVDRRQAWKWLHRFVRWSWVR